MKILIINYRFFVSGGPERYMFNLIDLLESKGHEVIPFSIKYKKNIYTPYSKYFASPISSEDEVFFREQSKNLKSVFKSISRVFYSFEVYNKLTKLIRNTNPDFAIVLHYQKKLSPSVITALDNNKVPFIVRLSDFIMVCPNAHLIRNNNICEKCIEKSLWQSVKYACVQNSKIASLINYFSLSLQKEFKIFNKIPFFIVPSKFTISKHIQAGWPIEKFVHVPSFINESAYFAANPRENRILFIGRIDRTKGVHVLLKAISKLKMANITPKVNIVGSGDDLYLEELKIYCKRNELSNVEFLGFLEKDQIFNLLQKSKATIIPSIWYDNQPNSALESLASGTPIIASNHGSLRELVINDKNGYLFIPGDSNDLAEKIKMILHHNNYQQMQNDSIQFVKENHSSKNHLNGILLLYKQLREN